MAFCGVSLHWWICGWGSFVALARDLVILILYLAFDGICLHLIRGGVYIVLVSLARYDLGSLGTCFFSHTHNIMIATLIQDSTYM